MPHTMSEEEAVTAKLDLADCVLRAQYKMQKEFKSALRLAARQLAEERGADEFKAETDLDMTLFALGTTRDQDWQRNRDKTAAIIAERRRLRDRQEELGRDILGLSLVG